MSSKTAAAISDHIPQFLLVLNIFSHPSSQKSNFYKYWSIFNQETFMHGYFHKDWPDLL